MPRTRLSYTVFLAAMAAVAMAATPSRTTFHAIAVNMSNVGSKGAEPIDITIERWSTDAEEARLRDALVEKGSDKLLGELQKIKPRAGYIRPSSGGLGWNIQYARRVDLPDGGYRVVFGTDRPMSFQELWNQPRSAEYDFMLGELRIRADGKGEGKVVPRAKIEFDKDRNVIEVENYASEPVRLTEVTQVEPKVKATPKGM
jgi:hypothetical protein